VYHGSMGVMGKEKPDLEKGLKYSALTWKPNYFSSPSSNHHFSSVVVFLEDQVAFVKLEHLLRAALINLSQWMLRLLSSLPGEVDDNSSFVSFTCVNVHHLILPVASWRFEFSLLRTGWGCLGSRLSCSLRTIRTILWYQC